MTWIVHTAHTSNYPNPISFQAGDVVEIGIHDDEFPGWIRVTTRDGNQGWAPIQYLHIDDAGKTATSLQDYSAREMNTRVGEQLILHDELNGWGWVENDHKKTGWVPLAAIQSIDDLDHLTEIGKEQGGRMTIINRPYNVETDYKKVSEFLIKHYLPGNADGNWLEPEWEYAYFHPMLDQEKKDRWRIWEVAGDIVAFAHYEWKMGEGFFQFHPDYRVLRKETLDYAEKNLTGISSRDGRKYLCAYVNDYDQLLLELVQNRGYLKEEEETRPLYRFKIPDPFPEISLVEGFSLISLADECDWEKVHRVMWRGFDHSGEPPGGEEELISRQKMFDTPKARRDLKIAVKAPNGDFVAFCGMFYEDHHQYAYVEPVATDPDYRRMGLGKAAVLEGIRRCGELGAKEAFVGSDQRFYQAIGFQKVFNTECWVKYFN